jgi:Zinc dependent phospholipase C
LQTSLVCRTSLLLVLMLCGTRNFAYSVLTHEELVDLTWNDTIRPMLLARFPGASEAQLRVAHAYAYGGSAIQDMGYYPFGKQFFSDLTHYVRTGDFVAYLLRNAKTIDEYAFAIGALSHYLGDTLGHSEAINPATGLEFPKLAKKYGPVITYDQSPHGHIRTEFAFDVQELTNAEFAPPSYLRFIGLKVPRKFLEEAFAHTYGFDIHEVLGRSRPALRSYRTAVRSFIPAFAEAEVVLHRHHFPPPPDDDAYRIFIDRVARTNYERKWKHAYKGPGFKAHLLAIVVWMVPKVGPASDLAIKIPTPQTQEWYLLSVNHTVDEFRATLQKLAADPKPVALANDDLDTGYPVRRGDYPLADKTYAKLLERLTSKPDRIIPEDVKHDIVRYYTDAAPGANSEKAAKSEKEMSTRLGLLMQMKSFDSGK